MLVEKSVRGEGAADAWVLVDAPLLLRRSVLTEFAAPRQLEQDVVTRSRPLEPLDPPARREIEEEHRGAALAVQLDRPRILRTAADALLRDAHAPRDADR